jgi:intracellular septation protein
MVQQVLKLVLELGPVVAFFVSNGRYGIFTGTMVFMVATVIAVAVSFALTRKVPIMPLVSGVFVLIFGGLTLYLSDELFIKLRPTIVNVIFSAILLFGLKTNRLFAKLIFESAFHLTDRGWILLTRAWICFFLFLAAMNEIVWRNVSTEAWIKYKMFGVMPLTLLYGAALIPLMMKHMIPEPAKAPNPPDQSS